MLEISSPILVGIYKNKELNSLTFLFYYQLEDEVNLKTSFEIKDVKFFRLENLPKNLAPGVKERIEETMAIIEQTKKFLVSHQ